MSPSSWRSSKSQSTAICCRSCSALSVQEPGPNSLSKDSNLQFLPSYLDCITGPAGTHKGAIFGFILISKRLVQIFNQIHCFRAIVIVRKFLRMQAVSCVSKHPRSNDEIWFSKKLRFPDQSAIIPLQIALYSAWFYLRNSQHVELTWLRLPSGKTWNLDVSYNEVN